MIGDPLNERRAEQRVRHVALDAVRARVSARLAALQARRLPSQRRAARVEELRGVLAELDDIEHPAHDD